jgi:hypothetical protein
MVILSAVRSSNEVICKGTNKIHANFFIVCRRLSELTWIRQTRKIAEGITRYLRQKAPHCVLQSILISLLIAISLKVPAPEQAITDYTWLFLVWIIVKAVASVLMPVNL